MFTGLIESLGRIVDGRRPRRRACAFVSDARLAAELTPGRQPGRQRRVPDRGRRRALTASMLDVSPETVRVTTLGALGAGTLVNLERPLRADARLGGHFVQGHVDATGTIDGRAAGGRFVLADGRRSRRRSRRYIVRKGSIAVDGISLTVAAVDDDRDASTCRSSRSPGSTRICAARPGDAVNLECDMLGKYVVARARAGGARRPGRRTE